MQNTANEKTYHKHGSKLQTMIFQGFGVLLLVFLAFYNLDIHNYVKIIIVGIIGIVFYRKYIQAEEEILEIAMDHKFIKFGSKEGIKEYIFPAVYKQMENKETIGLYLADGEKIVDIERKAWSLSLYHDLLADDRIKMNTANHNT